MRGAREVASLVDVERELRASPSPSALSLDLYGHSTRGHHHLRLGRDIVDVLDHHVASHFATLAADRVLSRAGVVQIRVLGCATAIGPAAAASLTRLARITGMPVIGTTKPLLDAHHGPDGFRPEFARLLRSFVGIRTSSSLLTATSIR